MPQTNNPKGVALLVLVKQDDLVTRRCVALLIHHANNMCFGLNHRNTVDGEQIGRIVEGEIGPKRKFSERRFWICCCCLCQQV